jgi:hypothetical protein
MLPPVYDWLDKIHLVLSETLLITACSPASKILRLGR